MVRWGQKYIKDKDKIAVCRDYTVLRDKSLWVGSGGEREEGIDLYFDRYFALFVFLFTILELKKKKKG